MKRYIWVVPVVALAALVLFTASRRFAAGSRSINGDVSPEDVTLGAATRGVVFATAAINRDGTVASCFTCNRSNTVHLGTGVYQVGFNTNVQATNGWSRWVQVDTLSTGSIFGVSCTTADRAGLATGVFVLCVDTAGADTDTSFFLFVAR